MDDQVVDQSEDRGEDLEPLEPLAPSGLTCTRRLQFCFGHRIMGHENKCAMLHGHNYVALITAQAPLDSIGRVIDFSVLKERVGGWIDQCWDHGFVLFQEDDEAINTLRSFASRQKVYVMPLNPTAENLARYLLESICPRVLAGTGVRVVRVRLWETENCYADARTDAV